MGADRFSRWARRAKTCYRAAASLDAARAALQAAQLEVRTEQGEKPEPGPLEEARRELAAAESACFAAREKLEAALREKTLTPANREPSYGIG